MTRASAGERLMWTLKIDKKTLIRTERPPINSSCSSSATSVTVPSAGETSKPGSRGTARGVAEEKQHKGQQHRRADCQVPVKESPQDRQCQQRPAHQLQLGQSPAGKRQAVAPREAVKSRVPVAVALVAAVFQIARIDNLVRCAGRRAAPQLGHPPRRSPGESAQIPPPPAPPSQFDLIANPAARLDATQIGRHGLGRAAADGASTLLIFCNPNGSLPP